MPAMFYKIIAIISRIKPFQSEWKEKIMLIPCDRCKHSHRFFERERGKKIERKQTCSDEGCDCKRFVYKKRKKLMR